MDFYRAIGSTIRSLYKIGENTNKEFGWRSMLAGSRLVSIGSVKTSQAIGYLNRLFEANGAKSIDRQKKMEGDLGTFTGVVNV